MRITAPSPINAVLSATATSLDGASLPRCAASVGIAVGERVGERTHRNARVPSRQCPTVPARKRRRRRRDGVPRHRRALRPPSSRRALAAASGGLASGFASRMSARRSVYFQSSMRRWGKPSFANTSKAASRCSATAPPPGSRVRASAKACASAVSAAVLMTFTSAIAFIGQALHSSSFAHDRALTPRPLPDTRHSRALRVRAPIPCRRSSRCGPWTARAPRRARCR